MLHLATNIQLGNMIKSVILTRAPYSVCENLLSFPFCNLSWLAKVKIVPNNLVKFLYFKNAKKLKRVVKAK